MIKIVNFKLCMLYHNKSLGKKKGMRLGCFNVELIREYKTKEYKNTIQNYSRGKLKHCLLKEMSLFQI